MSLRRKWKVSCVAVLSAGALIAGTSATLTPALARASSSAATDRIVGVPGVAHRVPQHHVASTGRPSTHTDRGERHAVAPGSTADPTSVPAASRPATTASGTLLQNFNGTSSHDSEVTNYNAEFEPPDQGLCAGNGFVLEPVNSAYNIYKQDGTKIRGPFNVNDIFNEGGEEYTSDPRCYYDPSYKRWFVIILWLDINNFRSSRLDIAISSSSDPTGFWFETRIDTTNDGTNGSPKHHGCPCLGDQPLLGVDAFNLYVSTNEFSILGDEFNGAQVYAIPLEDLVFSDDVPYEFFGNLRNGSHPATSLQPAITTGTASAEYFMDSFDSDSTGQPRGSRLGVWAMTNRDAIDTGTAPVLSQVVIHSEPYSVPPSAAQKGSQSRIEPNDDRMQQVQFIGGTLWGELGTGLTPPGDPTRRAGAAWFAVKPVLSGDTIGSASIKKQGYVADPGDYLLMPAMQADAAGNAAMVFTLTGATHYPSAAYAVLQAGASEFGPAVIAANGTGPYDPNAGRWGDYSWAILDRSADAVWLATEYIPPKPSQTDDGRRNWGTRVLEVQLT
ncbi:MAG: hypothetical protein ACJ735_08315 [Actinomycetes bacterium]